MMLYLIWVIHLIVFVGILWYKSKQPPMTKGEQFYELALVAQRENSLLMNTTKDNPYWDKE